MIPRHLMIGVGVMLTAVLLAGLYLWHVQGREQAMQPATADSQPVAPPVSGPTEQITLYVADDDAGVLRPQSARIPLPGGRQQRAAEIIRALLSTYLDHTSTHVLPPASDIHDVYLVDPGVAVIDMNSAFADGHRSGILVEELTVASLVQTLAANVPGITGVRILVDGKQRDTLAGHADLTRVFGAAAANQMMAELSGQ
jgi:spore germination protein GerM